MTPVRIDRKIVHFDDRGEGKAFEDVRKELAAPRLFPAQSISEARGSHGEQNESFATGGVNGRALYDL